MDLIGHHDHVQMADQHVRHGSAPVAAAHKFTSLITIMLRTRYVLRNPDQETAVYAERVFMPWPKLVLVARFEVPAESMLFG
jgi:hypothetical protein